MRRYLAAYIGVLLFFRVFLVYSQVQTLVLQPGPTTGNDCYFNNVIPDHPDPAVSSFMACAWTFGGEPGVGRSLIKFDLTAVPVSATVISAKLDLYYIDNGNGNHFGDNESLLQKVTRDWNKMTATWNNQPEVTTINQVYLPTAVDSTQNYIEIDVTTLVAGMVQNPATNFGFLFRLVTEELYTRTILASCDNPDPAGRPRLTITYLTCLPPVAAFNYQVVDRTVTFTDFSSHATSWWWNFGDGYLSNLQNPVHNYTTPGIYSVCQTISDSCGSDTICKTVKVCKMPEPHFYYTTHAQIVSFHDSSTLPQSWFWDFGDGFYSDMENPEHYFNEPGTYYVCEKVTNACDVQFYCDSVNIIANSIGDDAPSFGVTLYPNPAHHLVWLHFRVQAKKTVSVEMLTPMSHIVGKWVREVNPGGEPVSLDIAGLPGGVYFLLIKIEGDTRLNKLIIL
jgi:PKD repeat protein